MLGNKQRSVRFDDDLDICLGEAELLGKSRKGGENDRNSGQNRKEEPPPDGQDQPLDQNSTLGGSAAASGASKNSRTLNPNIPAMRLAGATWTELLKVSTASL